MDDAEHSRAHGGLAGLGKRMQSQYQSVPQNDSEEKHKSG